MYLMGDAKIWWRTRTKKDLSVGRPDWDVGSSKAKAKKAISSEQHVLNCVEEIEKGWNITGQFMCMLNLSVLWFLTSRICSGRTCYSTLCLESNFRHKQN